MGTPAAHSAIMSISLGMRRLVDRLGAACGWRPRQIMAQRFQSRESTIRPGQVVQLARRLQSGQTEKYMSPGTTMQRTRSYLTALMTADEVGECRALFRLRPCRSTLAFPRNRFAAL